MYKEIKLNLRLRGEGKCLPSLPHLRYAHNINYAFVLGYITIKSSGYGEGTRKAIRKWYLNKEPLETFKFIMQYKTYQGVCHKQIMNTIHLRSDDPCN